MGFKCGIVGLPNVGKSTLFNALTQTAAAEAANYPFCTIEPNVGEVAVPDPRLETLAAETGGKVVPLTSLDDLGTLIPKRAQRTPNDDREALWDSPFALIMVLLLITLEWVGRKMIRLV